MKSTKKLQEVYDRATGDYSFYTFNRFQDDAKSFIKDLRNHKIVSSMTVSRSGMTRHFNVDKYNMLINICIHSKFSWDKVKMSGCGMDMYWYMFYMTYRTLCTDKEDKKWGLNMASSYQKVL